jgi:hypothetical protein
MAILPPGSLLDHQLPIISELDMREPTLEESEAGEVNFVVIVSTVHQIDFLHLGSKGHRRAIFKYEKGLLRNQLDPCLDSVSKQDKFFILKPHCIYFISFRIWHKTNSIFI